MIESVQCAVLRCDECGDPFDADDRTMHFPSAADACMAAERHGWIAREDRAVCPACVAVAECAHLGHQWDHWLDVATDHYVGRVRRCQNCDGIDRDPPAVSRGEQR